ncbi:MAG: peptidoglycan DD-metalloendopeptidase family protein [Pseudomonadota bacterium]
MSRRSGKTARFISRFFKERQIYHRSDGVVHFISMSTRTQIALAVVIAGALMWVAYASVNVVFKEQIIVAKDRNERVQRDAYERKLERAHRAYNDMNALNVVLQEEFDEAMSEIASRHQTLRNMVERKTAVDDAIESLTQNLSEAGFPNGQRPSNSNRIMIDLAPAEPAPRRSRISALEREAFLEAQAMGGAPRDIPASSVATESLEKLDGAARRLYTEQMLLLARVEETAERRIAELRHILKTTGVSAERLSTPKKISNDILAQGGPFIDPGNVARASTRFFRRTNRAGLMIDELSQLTATIDNIPLSSPLIVPRRQTSGFGVRRDPFNGRAASHHGLDFAARWASPIVATAPGRVKYAGYRAGFGRTVEIDHGNGFVTRYAHLHKFVVKSGQKVKLHQKIGELGNSGRSTGPHIHYEILYKGRPKDPEKFIEAGRYVFES